MNRFSKRELRNAEIEAETPSENDLPSTVSNPNRQ